MQIVGRLRRDDDAQALAALAHGGAQIVEQIGIRRLRIFVEHPERRRRPCARLSSALKAFIDAAGAVALHYLDHFAVALDIAAALEFRDRLDDRFHLGEDQSGLQLVVGARIDFAARLAFRAQQMTQRQTGQQTGFAVAARLALDRDPDLAPAILADTRRKSPRQICAGPAAASFCGRHRCLL